MSANEQVHSSTGEGNGMKEEKGGLVDYFRKLYEQELERRVGAELEVKQMKPEVEAKARKVSTAAELAPVVVVPVRMDVGVQTEPVTILEGEEKGKKVVAVDGAGGDGGRVHDQERPSTSAGPRSRSAPESESDDEMPVLEVEVEFPSKKEEKKDKDTETVCVMPMRPRTLKNRIPTRVPTSTPKTPDHIRILTGVGGEPSLYQCVPCDRKFGSRPSVSYHRFCGTGQKPFQCESCGKGFPTRSSFETHLRSHTCERPFKCTQCAKTFRYKGEFNKHLITHTGEQSVFKLHCHHCWKGFALKSVLDIHLLRSHSKAQERPWACHQCSKDFCSHKDLLQHRLRVHPYARPYKCSMCGCIAKSKDQIENHIRTAHNQQPRQMVVGVGEGRPGPSQGQGRMRMNATPKNLKPN